MSKDVQVRLEDCDDVVCSEKDCENGLFIQAFMLKRVPGLMISQPKDKIVNVAKRVCTVCGTVYDPADQPKKENKIEIVK